MGTLYIVATPIGNMQDISIRSANTLFTVEVIACEDTRRTGLLLQKIADLLPNKNTKKPRFVSYYEKNEKERVPMIISILKSGLRVALVSDAGTPLISDPGFKLVRECLEEGIKVESIPGPSSVITALSVSGLPTDKFLFLGYLTKKEGKKLNFLSELKSMFENSKNVKPTVIFFESPYRVVATLESLQIAFGDIDIVICRELTKLYEEIRREKVSIALKHFKKTTPKGEFVILLHI